MIGFRAAGTVANNTVEPVTVTLPAGFQPGDMHVLIASSKTDTAPTVVTPAGWNAPANSTATGGAGVAGIDTGLNFISLFWRIAQTGDGNASVDFSAAGSPMQCVILGFTKDASESWSAVQCAVASDTTGSTTLYDPAVAAITLTLRDGNWLGVADAINGDAGTPTLPGTLTVSGVTFGTVVNRLNAGTNAGNDARLMVDTAPCQGGTPGAGPDRSVTYTAANASMAGCSVFFQLEVNGPGKWPQLIHPGRGPFMAQSLFNMPQLSVETEAVETVSASGTSLDGASAHGTAINIVSPVGTCVGGSLAQGVATKIAAASGSAVGGSLARGVATHIGIRSGTSVGGSLAQGVATHIGIPVGASSAGALTYGTAVQITVVTPIGRCSAGALARGTTALIAIPVARSVAGSLAQGTASLRAISTGRSVGGPLAQGIASGGVVVLTPVGRCSAGGQAQGRAIVKDEVLLAMESADIFVGPLMNELLACLCEQSTLAPNPPGICCFRVGTEVAHDAGINEDQCCEGIGYVMLGDTYPSSTSFPEQDVIRQAEAKCPPTTWAQSFKLGIIRCVEVGDAYNPLNCNSWNQAAIQNVHDAQTLRRVACCFRDFIIMNNDKFVGMSVVIDRQIQGGIQGGCVERSLMVTAQVPNCNDGC